MAARTVSVARDAGISSGQGRLAAAQFAQPGALGGDLTVVGVHGGPQSGQLTVQGGDFGRGLGRLGAQATGAGLFVAILGLQARHLTDRRGLADGRGGDEQAEDGEDEGATHQSR